MTGEDSTTQAKAKCGWTIAVIYFVVPLATVGIVWVWWPSWFSSEHPVHAWRLIYCFLAGWWGLAIRAFERRKLLSPWPKPWPDYFTLYPFVLLINAFAVFASLSLASARLGDLFWFAAVPLCVVCGRYCHPKEWILTKILINRADNEK